MRCTKDSAGNNHRIATASVSLGLCGIDLEEPKKQAIRHYRGWQFIPLVFFVLVLVLSETVLLLEGKHRDFVDKRDKKYWGFSFPEKVIDLNRHGRFRVRVRVPQR